MPENKMAAQLLKDETRTRKNSRARLREDDAESYEGIQVYRDNSGRGAEGRPAERGEVIRDRDTTGALTGQHGVGAAHLSSKG